DTYTGLQLPNAQFSVMVEGPPGSRGLGYPPLKFLDEGGAQVAYRALTRNYNRDTAGMRKAQYGFRFPVKPRSMVFTRTLKTATREYELQIPAVPVPFGDIAPIPVRRGEF